ncbi:hypothetical protein XNC3_620005 [Xenorhabdus nematophila F1]|nr:hypothetical protein XNC3_620005 [Xenorhabdus nematophila F1]
MRRRLGHHQQLLTQLLSAEGPVADYALLTDGERARLCAWQSPSRATLSAGGVTRLYIVPSHLESLLSEPAVVAQLGGLRHCITAGEPLPVSLARRARGASCRQVVR